MIQQELFFENTIHRFELKVNSNNNGYEGAFNLYGVLVIPTLLGGILMYNIFELRQEYFTITFSLMIIILVNIYFFYHRMIYNENSIKLILLNNYIQLIDRKEIHFKEYIEELKVEIIFCGKKLEPALSISSKNLEEMVIGLKNINIEHPIETKKQLRQPDYWLYNRRQANLLIDILCNEHFALKKL